MEPPEVFSSPTPFDTAQRKLALEIAERVWTRHVTSTSSRELSVIVAGYEATLQRIESKLCERCDCSINHEQPCHCTNDE